MRTTGGSGVYFMWENQEASFEQRAWASETKQKKREDLGKVWLRQKKQPVQDPAVGNKLGSLSNKASAAGTE